MKILEPKPHFSAVENKILEEINNNTIAFLKLNLVEFAKIISCSKSAISRLAKMLDFDSYLDFKLYVQERVILKYFYYDINSDLGSKKNSIIRINNAKCYNNYASNITIEQIDIQKFQKTITSILNAKQVFLFGSGSSKTAPLELCEQFIDRKINSEFSFRIHETIQLLEKYGPSDLVIIFAHKGLSENAKEILKLQSSKKFQTFVISNDEELCQKAKHSIVIREVPVSKSVLNCPSKIIQMLLSEIIINEVDAYLKIKSKPKDCAKEE